MKTSKFFLSTLFAAAAMGIASVPAMADFTVGDGATETKAQNNNVGSLGAGSIGAGGTYIWQCGAWGGASINSLTGAGTLELKRTNAGGYDMMLDLTGENTGFTGIIKIYQTGTGTDNNGTQDATGVISNALLNLKSENAAVNATVSLGAVSTLLVGAENVKIAGLRSDTSAAKYPSVFSCAATAPTGGRATNPFLQNDKTVRTLEITGSGDYTFAGIFGDKRDDRRAGLNLKMSGTGTQTLSGPVNAGTVSVTAGTLKLTGATNATSLSVAGGKLTISGATTLSGAINVATGGTLRLEERNVVTGATGVTLAGTLEIGATLSETDSVLSTAGTFTVGAGATIAFKGAIASGAYAILSSANTLSDADLAIIQTTSATGVDVTLSAESGKLIANVVSTIANLTWTGGDGVWNEENTNWINAGSTVPVTYTDLAQVRFTSNAAVTLGMVVSPIAISVLDGATVSLTGDNTNKITGMTAVSVGGNSTLTLAGAHDYTGATTIAEGSKLIWELNSDASSFTTRITNSGTFEKAGTGTLSFGADTIGGTGTLAVSQGVLKMTAFREGSYSASGTGILELASAGTLTSATTISGDGTVKSSANMVIATNANTNGFTGTVQIASGTFQWGQGGTNAAAAGAVKKFGDTISVGANGLTLHLWTGSARTTSTTDKVIIDSNISLAGGTLTVTDGSHYFARGLTVSGNSTFTCIYAKGFVFNGIQGTEGGTLTLNRGPNDPDDYSTVYGITGTSSFNGTIKVATTHGAAKSTLNILSQGAAENAVIELTDATKTILQINVDATIAGLTGNGAVNPSDTNSVLTINNTANYTYSGSFANGGIRKKGTGTQTFSADVYASSVFVDAGTLTFSKTVGKAGGTITVNGGTLNINGVANSTGTVAVLGGTLKLAAAGGKLATSNIIVKNGSLDLGSTAALTAATVNISLENGTITKLLLTSGKVLTTGAGSRLVDFGLNGGTIKFGSADSIVYVGGANATINGVIDYSNISFSVTHNTFTAFTLDAAYGAKSTFLANLNSNTTAAGGVSGAYTFAANNRDIIFTASGGLVLDWNNASEDKQWTVTSFSGEAFGATQSVRFNTFDGTENVEVIGEVIGNNVLFSGGEKAEYIIGGTGTLTLDGSLRATSGKGVLNVATSTKGGIEVAGGTLVGTVADSLKVTGTTAKVVVSGGTLSVEHASALNVSTIDFSNGTIAFVTGALNGIATSTNNTGGLKINTIVSGGSATIKWLDGNTQDISNRLAITAGSTVVFDTGANNVVFGTGQNTQDSSYVKMGSGNLSISTADALHGSLTIREGSVSLDSVGDATGLIKGAITVEKGTLNLNKANVFGNGGAGTLGNTTALTVLAGGNVVLFSDEAGQDNQEASGLTISLGGGTISGNSTHGFDLMNGSSISTIADSETSTISSRLQIRQTSLTVTTAANTTLSISGAIVDSDTDATTAHALVKDGEGTLQFNGKNEYKGNTTVNAGTLLIGTGGSLASPSIVLNNASKLVVNLTGTADFGGSLSGTGSLSVEAGTAIFATTMTHTGGTSVSEGASLYINGAYNGALTLNGTFGGNGSYTGDVTLGAAATLYAGDTQTFNFNGTVVSGSSIAKTGAGTVSVGASVPGTDANFSFTVNAGTLSTAGELAAPIVNLNGGTLGTTGTGSWTIRNLNVSADSTIAGAATVANTPQNEINFSNNSRLAVSGSLNSAGTLVLKGEGSLNISGTASTNALVIGADFSSGTANALDVALGGSFSTTDATFENGVRIGGAGALNIAGTATFNAADAVNSTIAGVNLTTSADTIFNVTAGLVNVTATIDATSTTLRKTGAGTLQIGASLNNFVGSIAVDAGTLRLASSGALQDTTDISVSGAGSVLDVGTATISKNTGTVSITNGAKFTGNISASGINFTATDAEIDGALEVTGSNIVFGNLTVGSHITIGTASEITFDGSGPAVKGSGRFNWANGGVVKLSNTGAIGTEHELARFSGDGQLNLATISLDQSVLDATGRAATDLELVYDTTDAANKVLKIVAYGTLIWDGAETWNDTDTGWKKTVKGTDPLEDQTFTSGNFVDVTFNAAGANNTIAVGTLYNTGVVNIGGISFTGVAEPGAEGNTAAFQVNFNGEAGFADNIVPASISVNAGTVTFSGNFDNNFSGGLFISSGASFVADGVVDADHKLGTGKISLGGSFALNQGGTLANNFEITGANASISVGADAEIAGTISGAGATLTKLGAGTLSVAANISVSNVVLSEGNMNVTGTGTVGVSQFTVVAGSTLDFSADSTFSQNGLTSFSTAGTINFGAENVNISRVVFTDGGGTISAGATDTGSFHIGGTNVAGTSVIAGLINMASTAEESNILGNLVLEGASVGNATTSLTAAVGGLGTLSISGGVSDGANAGTFNFIKTGTGTLSFGGAFNSVASVILQGGTLSVGAGTNMAGNIGATGNSTFNVLVNDTATSTIGAVGKTLTVNAGRTLSLRASSDGTLSQLKIAGNLAIAGTLSTGTIDGASILFEGANNTYNSIRIGDDGVVATAAIADGVIFEGTELRLYTGSNLVVNGTVNYSAAGMTSGNLRIGDASTLTLGNGTTPGQIRFSTLIGLNNNPVSFSIAGSGRAEFSETIAAPNIVVDIAENATLALGSNIGVILGNFTGTGTVEKDGLGQWIVSNTSDFGGNVNIKSGEALLNQNGAFGDADITVGNTGTLRIASGTATTFGAGEGLAVGKTLSGDGVVVVSGNNRSLSFGAGSILDTFTGTLIAEEGATLNYTETVANSNASKIVLKAGALAATGLNLNVKLTLERSETLTETLLGIVKLSDNSQLNITSLDQTGVAAAANLKFGMQVGDGSTLTISDTITNVITSLEKSGVGTAIIASTATPNAQAQTRVVGGKLVFQGNNAIGGTPIVASTADANSVATVRLENMTDGTVFANRITTESYGTIESASSVTLSGISDTFAGTVSATDGANLTIVKSNGTLGNNADNDVIYTGTSGSTVTIDTTATVGTEISDNRARFSGDGKIAFAIGTDKTLIVSAANNLAGNVEVKSGSLWLSGNGTFGTGDIALDANSTLRVSSAGILNSISGAGTLVHKDAGTSFIGGEISANTRVERGTLSIQNLKSGTSLTIANGSRLLLSQAYDVATGTIVERSSGSSTFTGLFGIEGDSVTFIHSGANSSSKVVPFTGTGWISGKAPTSTTEIQLLGGGDGSEFALAINNGSVIKGDSGKWILSNYGSGDSLLINAGTLSIKNYTNSATRNINIGSASFLEILDFSGGEDTISGKIGGSGTLLISATDSTVKLNVTSVAGSTWDVAVGAGATLMIESEIANNINLADNSALKFAVGAGNSLNYGGNIAMNSDGNSEIEKTGAGTLNFTSDIDLLGSLLIKEGNVVVNKSIGRTTSGNIDIRSGAKLTFDVGSGSASQLYKKVSGEGDIVFKTGTTTVRAVNNAFSGNVQIQGNSIVKLGGATTTASFGGATVVIDDSAELSIQQKTSSTINNLSGAGTLSINTEINGEEEVVTTYGSGNSAFTGKIRIDKGILALSSTLWDSFNNGIVFHGVNATDSAFRLVNSSATDFALTDRANLSGVGVFELQNTGAGNFKLNGTFGSANTTLAVLKNSTLDLGASAGVVGALVIRDGGTLVLKGTEARNNSVSGNIVIAGKLNATVSSTNIGNTFIHATGNATIASTAVVTIRDEETLFASGGSLTLISADGSAFQYGSSFETEGGDVLNAIVRNGNSIVLSLAAPVVDIVPSGLECFNSLIISNTSSEIYNAIYGSGTPEEQTAKLRNFSPISFAGTLELMSGFAQIEADLLRERLEQRRYDRGNTEAPGTIKAFANVFGNTTDTSDGEDKAANYNLNHFGAIAGFDTAINKDLLIGFSVAYDRGSVDIHNGGGKHEMSSSRIGFYGMQMINEVSYFGFGASFGISGFDTKRTTALETVKGDTDGTDFALSATFGTIYGITETLHISPYVGMDFSYASVTAFEEKANTAGLNVGNMDRTSIRGVVGATLNWVANDQFRLGLEMAFHHEFGDTDTDIDATFNSGSYSGSSFSAKAYLSGENSLSIGPRIEWSINDKWSASAGYTFEADLDNTVSHSANVGFRCRF